MAQAPHIGRKLTYKRRQCAVQQIAPTPAMPTPKPLPVRRALANPQWEETYQAWTQSHAETPSGLTPDMLRRENLYDEGA